MTEPLATEVPSKTPENPLFDMPDAHIRSIEEQEAQETWATLMIGEDDEPQFWLNMLETLEEMDSFPSELEIHCPRAGPWPSGPRAGPHSSWP